MNRDIALKRLSLVLGLIGLFSLFFNNVFYVGVFIASIAALTIHLIRLNNLSFRWALFLVAIVGSSYDVYSYFSVSHAQGNSYGAWILLLPINLVLFLIAKNKCGID